MRLGIPKAGRRSAAKIQPWKLFKNRPQYIYIDLTISKRRNFNLYPAGEVADNPHAVTKKFGKAKGNI
jgi:hypothetical protein